MPPPRHARIVAATAVILLAALLPAVVRGDGAAGLLAAGSDHTCAIASDSSLKCWGGNEFGQLGAGDNAARGDDAGETGDALAAVDLGPGAVVRQVAAGGDSTCAVLADGSLRCFGDNIRGQLGHGGGYGGVGDGAGEMGASLGPGIIAPGRRVMSVAMGGDSSASSRGTRPPAPMPPPMPPRPPPAPPLPPEPPTPPPSNNCGDCNPWNCGEPVCVGDPCGICGGAPSGRKLLDHKPDIEYRHPAYPFTLGRKTKTCAAGEKKLLLLSHVDEMANQHQYKVWVTDKTANSFVDPDSPAYVGDGWANNVNIM